MIFLGLILPIVILPELYYRLIIKKMLQFSFTIAAKYCIQFQETGAAHVTSALANPDVTIFMWHTFIHQIQK